MIKEKLFQIGVKALIVNKQGKILVLDSGDWHLKHQQRHWDIPGGRIQEGHSILETLRREMAEETGITKFTKPKFFSAVISNFESRLEDGRTAGLALMIYRVGIPENSKIILSEEHSGYEWVSKKVAAERLRYKYPAEFTDQLAAL